MDAFGVGVRRAIRSKVDIFGEAFGAKSVNSIKEFSMIIGLKC